MPLSWFGRRGRMGQEMVNPSICMRVHHAGCRLFVKGALQLCSFVYRNGSFNVDAYLTDTTCDAPDKLMDWLYEVEGYIFFTDIINAATKGKLEGKFFERTHEEGYWDKKYNIPSEIFANMGTLKVTGQKAFGMLPRTKEIYNEMLDKMLNQM